MCGDLLGSAGRTGRTRSLPGFFCLYSCHRSLRVTCFLASLLRICSNGDIPLPSTSRGKGKGAYRCPSRYAKSPLSFSLTASYSPLVFLAVFGAKPTMALTFLACLSGSFGGGRIHHNRWPVWVGIRTDANYRDPGSCILRDVSGVGNITVPFDSRRQVFVNNI